MNTDISEYEQVRLENIKRNQAFLNNLGLDDVKPEVPLTSSTKRSISSRGATAKKHDVVPLRRSSRVTIEKLKEELDNLKSTDHGQTDNEIKEKEELLKSMVENKYAQNVAYSTIDSMETTPQTRLPREPLSLLSPTNQPETTTADDPQWGKALIDILIVHDPSLSNSSSISLKPKRPKTASNIVKPESDVCVTVDSNSYIKALKKLSVAEDDVAKLTESRISSVWCHPSTSKLICAAGDKAGNLGVWDVDSKTTGTDGVFKYKPHIEGINKIFSWNHEPSKLYTCSYDGTIRFFDINSETISLAFEEPEDYSEGIAFSDVAYLESIPNILLIGRSDGKMALVDLRVNSSLLKNKYEWCTASAIHAARIQSIQYHPTNENMIITAGAKMTGSICMHDIRKKSSSGGSWKPVLTLSHHTKSINAAYCSPDGKSLVSVSQDNTVRVYTDFVTASDAAEVKTSKINHDNHTGRWLSTFRPTFDPKHDHFFVLGSMDRPRRVEIFSSSNNDLQCIASIQSDPYLGSVCSRNCFHPFLNIIIGGNSSGRLHVLR